MQLFPEINRESFSLANGIRKWVEIACYYYSNNISQYIFYEQEFQTLGTIKKENDAFLAKEKRQAVYVSKEKR